MTLQHLDTALAFAAIILLLSLLITVIVQTVVAVLGLRGRNLQWGVAQLLTQIDPALGRHADTIADRVLRFPAIAPLVGRKATAIRAEELVRVLEQVVRSDAPWDDPEAKAALQQLLEEMLPGSGDLSDKAAAITSQLAAKFPAQAEDFREAVAAALGQTRKVVAGVNTWFSTIMDRTTERFVLQTRWTTAAAALLFALLLHVDSLQLLDRLSSDSEFRSKVVAASQGILARADSVGAQTAERKAVASQAVRTTRDSVKGSDAAAAFGEIPSDLITKEQGEAWLRGRLANVNSRDSVLAIYQRQFAAATRAWTEELGASRAAIDSQLTALGLQLVPQQFPDFGRYLKNRRHVLGTLMTVLFLSLGAPFWFNLLRQLANLRPVIARKVEEEAKGEGQA